ncbi:MAG: hypothetical protein IT349_17105 [Candidatus Eisenbacteria bacterium]|nr:hypothetical protein [Candidatus Eisenbacteria bacterium]
MSADVPQSIRSPHVLLAEGRDLDVFLQALLRNLGIGGVEIFNFGGVSQCRPFLEAFVLTPGFELVERLGVVRDAEGSASSARDSLRDAISNAGLRPSRREEIWTGQRPSVGYFILPGGGRDGALEDLCLDSVREDPALACVDSFFECLSRRRPPPLNPRKARLMAFLASRERHVPLVGNAANAGVFPFDSPAFQTLKSFLAQLRGTI